MRSPIIKDGALMLVDTRPNQHVRSGCFYIIVLDGDVLVKLINRRIDGTIELISHNPAYPKEIIDSQQLDRLTIPGQVVWYGQKL
nr:S24 family peptidase [Devosia sp. JXJ CY 41]